MDMTDAEGRMFTQLAMALDHEASCARCQQAAAQFEKDGDEAALKIMLCPRGLALNAALGNAAAKARNER